MKIIINRFIYFLGWLKGYGLWLGIINGFINSFWFIFFGLFLLCFCFLFEEDVLGNVIL